ncbi:MAG: bifunctional DNA primase/polymerase [Candidatus Micrarchaeaceae archaeon]
MMEERFPGDPHPQENETKQRQNSNTDEQKYLSSSIFNDPRFRVLKIKIRSKEPVERGWTTVNNYLFDSKEINDWIRRGGNYGIFCPKGDCAFIDADTVEIQKVLDGKLPTFWYTSGRAGHRQYIYEILDPPMRNIPLRDGAYVKGQNGYALGPGSVHPNGRVYGLEKNDEPIREVYKDELLSILQPFLIRPPEPRENKPIVNTNAISWISLNDLIDLSRFRKSGNRYQGPHPVHGSETGLNLSVNLEKNVWHCFRHDSGGGPLQWIAVAERIINCEDSVPGGLRGDKFWQALEVAHAKYGLTVETAVKMLKEGSKNEF